jgi:hypothetical protein
VLEVLADALGPQDILIVLDNCEHLIAACAKTAETILQRCPKVHLIATSREPLGIGGETIYRVPSMSLPRPGDSGAIAASCDAVALFAARARAQGVSLALDADTIALVVSVCRRLDAMPLAVELAAARLRSMSPADLASRLDQRFRLLTGGSRTVLERQQTLRAAVDWSYLLLTTAEQVLLGRLSVFAAEKLVGAGPEEAAAARMAHSAHYLAVAETAAPHLAGPQQGSWFDRLEADQTNLRRAAEHAAGEPDGTAQVLRLGVALWRYWLWWSREEEAAGLLLPVLRRPEAAADPALFAEALIVTSDVTLFTDMPTGLQLAGEADAVASRLGDDRLLVLSRGTLAASYYFAGEPERGRPLGAESVERARQLGDDVLLGWSPGWSWPLAALARVMFRLATRPTPGAGSVRLPSNRCRSGPR